MSAPLLVGYDGSDCADLALDRALALGAELGAPVLVAFDFGVNPVGGEVTDYRAALEEHAQRVPARARERERPGGVEVETVIAEEDPAHALVDLARRRDARLIVVGSRGETPLRGALVGSTPQELLEISHRPVLVVPAKRDDDG